MKNRKPRWFETPEYEWALARVDEFMQSDPAFLLEVPESIRSEATTSAYKSEDSYVFDIDVSGSKCGDALPLGLIRVNPKNRTISPELWWHSISAFERLLETACTSSRQEIEPLIRSWNPERQGGLVAWALSRLIRRHGADSLSLLMDILKSGSEILRGLVISALGTSRNRAFVDTLEKLTHLESSAELRHKASQSMHFLRLQTKGS
jgi:hypothetical protein